jgi:LAO/AO transport system kinase
VPEAGVAADALVSELVGGVRAGSRAHVARAITLVESRRPDHRQRARSMLAQLAPAAGLTIRVGISGIPGAGKSTFIDALGVRLVDRGHRVAVVAVDPSSTRTGGSILGDRTRMAALAASPNAFVRPSPTGRHLGGVARATRESMLVLEAAGFDIVLVETVGVGQSEVAVADMVDTFLLLALARAGDQLQGIKRGILELADVVAVNKADGEFEAAARASARELSVALRLVATDPNRPVPAVLTCSAHTGAGLDDVWAAVRDHYDGLLASGTLAQRRAHQQREWMWSMVDMELRDALRRSPAVRAVEDDIDAKVEAGTLSAVEGTEQILDAFQQALRRDGWPA